MSRPAVSESVLQWGRNLSVAEGAWGCTHVSAGCKLQWGRNLSVAEGGWIVCARVGSTGFNGAATFRLRKGGSRRSWPRAV